MREAVKRFLFLLPLAVVLASCLTAPVSNSGGMGSVTVQNTNVNAIANAAQGVFANSGYTPGPSNFPASISFEKPAGKFGQLMYGSYDQKVTMRVKLDMTQIPGSNNYRLSTRVSRVSNAGEAGFEDKTKMLGLWSGEFGPLLKQIQAQASGAGPGY